MKVFIYIFLSLIVIGITAMTCIKDKPAEIKINKAVLCATMEEGIVLENELKIIFASEKEWLADEYCDRIKIKCNNDCDYIINDCMPSVTVIGDAMQIATYMIEFKKKSTAPILKKPT